MDPLREIGRPGLRLRVGEVTAGLSGGRITVLVDESSLKLPSVRGYTPTVGDQVLVLLRGQGGYVVGALGSAPPPPPAPEDPVNPWKPPPPEDPVKGSDPFKPVFTGSYRGGWRGDTRNLYQGDWSGRGVNTGAAYFGLGPRGLRGATATRVRITLERLSGGIYGGQSPTLRLLTDKKKPAGAPAEVGPSTAGPSLDIGERRTFDLPVAWGQSMIDGNSGGVGIRVAGSSPYIQLNGARIVLRIDWRK